MNLPGLSRAFGLFRSDRPVSSDRSVAGSGRATAPAKHSLLRTLTGLEWPPRFVRNWRTAALLSAATLVILGIALWICILVVMTVIGIRRGDVASALRRALGHPGGKREAQ